MEFENGLISFKSLVIPFTEERSGRKSNTVRMMSNDDYNQLCQERLKSGQKYKIRIFVKCLNICVKGDIKFFERTITNVSVVGEIAGQKLVVISWKNEERDAKILQIVIEDVPHQYQDRLLAELSPNKEE